MGFLDFRAVDVVREPPAALAQELRAAWTSVDLRSLSNRPQARAFVLHNQNWAMSGSRPALPMRRDPIPHGAFYWLCSRIVMGACLDVAMKGFARAHPHCTVAFRFGEEPRKRVARTRPVAVRVTPPVTEQWADLKQRDLPLLVHARATRERLCTWAAALSRLGTERNGPLLEMLGRSAAAPFALYDSSWDAFSTWPEALLDETQQDAASA